MWMLTVLKPLTDESSQRSFETLGRLFTSETSSLRRLVIVGFLLRITNDSLLQAYGALSFWLPHIDDEVFLRSFMRGGPIGAIREELTKQVEASSEDGVLKLLQVLMKLPVKVDEMKEHQLGKVVTNILRDSTSAGTFSLTFEPFHVFSLGFFRFSAPKRERSGSRFFAFQNIRNKTRRNDEEREMGQTQKRPPLPKITQIPLLQPSSHRYQGPGQEAQGKVAGINRRYDKDLPLSHGHSRFDAPFYFNPFQPRRLRQPPPPPPLLQ